MNSLQLMGDAFQIPVSVIYYWVYIAPSLDLPLNYIVSIHTQRFLFMDGHACVSPYQKQLDEFSVQLVSQEYKRHMVQVTYSYIISRRENIQKVLIWRCMHSQQCITRAYLYHCYVNGVCIHFTIHVGGWIQNLLERRN